MAFPAHSGPRPLIQFSNRFYTDGRTPWTNDQPVARALPKHRTTQTQNKRIHTPNIHALRGILTHYPSVRASEDSLCLTARGHCDRRKFVIVFITSHWTLCRGRWIRPRPYYGSNHHNTRIILRCKCKRRFPSGLFPTGFPINAVCAFTCHCPASFSFRGSEYFLQRFVFRHQSYYFSLWWENMLLFTNDSNKNFPLKYTEAVFDFSFRKWDKMLKNSATVLTAVLIQPI
jgi:hypothetical protein